jgi:branched-chain amino acid transport system substrate-binding protein
VKITKSILGSLIVAPLLLMGGWAQAQSVEGVSKTSITLGQSVPLTGQGATLAVPFHQGAKLYFDRVNAAGGVNGRKIDLVTLDGAGVVATTTANTAKFIEQGVLALFGYYGSPQVTAAYAAIKDTDLLIFAPMAAAGRISRGALPQHFFHPPRLFRRGLGHREAC